MKATVKFEDEIRVQVTKRLAKDEIRSIVQGFIRQGLTFAISRHNSDFEVWRQILPGDTLRVKNRKDGMMPNGVIEQDATDLEARNFVCIWENGKLVYGNIKEI